MKPWKVQKFFGDVVYDLRSRGLLPVVILLLVAMVAVPMVISRGSRDSSSTASLQATAGTVAPAPEGERAVVSYIPGIRDYKKRLNDLSPKDPFRQQFAHSAAAASQLNSTVSTATPTGSATSTSESSTTASSGGGSSSTGKEKKKRAKPVSVTYQVDVLAGDVNAALTPFKNVASMTPLPSQSAPAVIYFGLTSDRKQAMFLVSNRVDSLNGPGTCVPAPDDCALLTLAPGQSEDLHYTQDGKTYRLVVARINRFTK
jgi:hypothetical protein